MKAFLRKFIPKSLYLALAPIYHGTMAFLAALYYGSPAKEMQIIGVTGTSGKSTTVIMLAHILNNSGVRTGYITTVSSFDGRTESINQHGLSMPGPLLLQKTLHDFAAKGCKYVIMEATSEGLAQNRHLSIKFEGALFTNLTPAHLDSHGSFENYRKAKGRLFESLSSHGFIGVNVDDPNYSYFASFPARKKFGISIRDDKTAQTEIPILKATNIQVGEQLQFAVEGQEFSLNIKGSFNIANALLAIGAAQTLGISLEQSAAAMKQFGGTKGRMEIIPNERNLTIIVDYAPEPASMEASLRAALLIPHKKLIHIFGSTGGHRDVGKRFEFGKISAQFADTIIITNDDVYESNPEEIAANIEQGINQTATKKVNEIIKILDRKEAIKKALQIAEPTDIILITGKGSEQFLVLPNNQRIEWDERQVIEDLLR